MLFGPPYQLDKRFMNFLCSWQACGPVLENLLTSFESRSAMQYVWEHEYGYSYILKSLAHSYSLPWHNWKRVRLLVHT